jgi:three-Cys-motif partner protein
MLLSRERVSLVFMEKDRRRYEHLQGELTARFGPLDDLPVSVKPCHGSAGTDAEAVLSRVGAWGDPILAVFDSWGNVNVPLTLIERIAHNPSSEVIVTFGPNWFSRREDLNTRQLDSVFGGRAHWERADRERHTDERWRSWLSSYRNALRRSGFRYQLHFRIVPRTGQPLYLVYGTGNDKGVEVMKAAMWDVDGTDGMGFQDPRTRGAQPLGQQTLWADRAQPELLELVRQRLEAGPVSLEELRRWLLLETAQWQEKHARQAVQEMEQDGAVSVHPSGRLTRTSMIRLR